MRKTVSRAIRGTARRLSFCSQVLKPGEGHANPARPGVSAPEPVVSLAMVSATGSAGCQPESLSSLN